MILAIGAEDTMDFRLKSCSSSSSKTGTSTGTFKHKLVENSGSISSDCRFQVEVDAVDRLSTLPAELLIRILSLLPTKDAAAACFLSRRMHRVFPWITALDFDATHIRHCSKHPSAIHQFPHFVSFVDTVLCAYQSQHLTKFRLRAGVGCDTRHCWDCRRTNCRNCFPDLKSTQISAWISFPFTRCCGLTELDIRILIKEPGDAQLPPEIFTSETLQVLKLDVNLGFDLISTFRLPKLKLCHIYAHLNSEDGFLARLVSSCPSLEDFSLKAACRNHATCASFSSPSLRRLHLKFYQHDYFDNTDVVLIDAPNLEYLRYDDNLAYHYAVQNMPGLVHAVVFIRDMLMYESFQPYNRPVFDLIRPLSNVQHLSLMDACLEALHSADVKEDQLPVFSNLKCLELGYNCLTYWNKVLIPFLNWSPVLETLVFPSGLAHFEMNPVTDRHTKAKLETEQEFLRGAHTNIIPQCCRVHLKRIVIKGYFGQEREVDLIQFLLRQAYVLEQLVIFRCLNSQHPIPDQISAETTLKMLPRASKTCSIQVM